MITTAQKIRRRKIQKIVPVFGRDFGLGKKVDLWRAVLRRHRREHCFGAQFSVFHDAAAVTRRYITQMRQIANRRAIGGAS